MNAVQKLKDGQAIYELTTHELLALTGIKMEGGVWTHPTTQDRFGDLWRLAERLIPNFPLKLFKWEHQALYELWERSYFAD